VEAYEFITGKVLKSNYSFELSRNNLAMKLVILFRFNNYTLITKLFSTHSYLSRVHSLTEPSAAHDARAHTDVSPSCIAWG
jgi:hypothetical protein